MSAQFLSLTSQRYGLSEVLSSLSSRRSLRYFWTVARTSFLVICIAILGLRLMDYVETNSPDEPSIAYPINTPPSVTGGRLLDDDLLLDPVSDTISWERYRNYCAHPLPAGGASTIAATQLACSALNGINVQWEGVIRQVTNAV